MNEANTQALQEHLGRLFGKSLSVSSPIEMLHMIREKINADSYESFYKQEILDEMGRLQRISRELNAEMMHIYELLKREG